MSSADLFEDGFPHGTPDGYDRGCRGAVCPAGTEHGLSCKTAKMKSRSDYQYQRLAKAGATVAEIADALGLVGIPAAGPAPSKRAKTPKPAPAPVAVLDDVEDLDQAPGGDAPTEPAPVETATAVAPAETPAPEPDTAAPAPTSREIRAWAREKGYEVSSRGVIPAAIVEHYWDAHGLLTPPAADEPTEAVAPHPEPLTDAHAIRAFVGPLRNDDGTLNASRVAQEATLREQAGLPAWIAELDAPPATEPAERPDFGTMNLEHDLTEALGERDRARDLAARLGEELARSEEQREQDRATTARTIKGLNDRLADAGNEILRFADIAADDRRTIDQLHTALAAASAALHTTERALELALTKWDEATRPGVPKMAAGGRVVVEQFGRPPAGGAASAAIAAAQHASMARSAR